MKLRTKLLLSFSCLLICIAAIAYTGLTSIDSIARYSTTIQYLNNALTNIDETRYYELSYVHYNDKSQVDIVLQRLDDAATNFNNAYKGLNVQQNRDIVKEALANLNVFREHFIEYVELHEATNASYNSLFELGELVSKNSLEALSLAEKLLEEEPSLFNITRYRGIVDATDNLYKGRIDVNRFIITPSKKNAEAVTANMAAAASAYNEVSNFFLGTRYSKEVSELVKQVKEYEVAANDYTKKALERDAYLVNIRTVMPTLTAQAAQVVENVIIVSKGVQERVYLQILIVLAISVAFGVGLSILLTHNVINALGRDPSQLSGMTKRVINGDYAIDDGGNKKGVYADLVAMVTSLKENIAHAAAESEKAKEESAKAQEATALAEKARVYAENAKRQGMLDAAAQLEGVVAVLSSASTQLSAQIEESERGSAEQSALVGETATAMEEMNATVADVARNASFAAEMAKLSKEKATEGAHVVTDSVSSIQKVRENSDALKEDMLTLVQHTQAISEIMSVISDIADQTNMLALNAAIEAARAGEAGRGFAVVADEVRNLAEKTMASTTNVSKVINSIQTSVDKSMKQLDATVTNVATSTEQAVRSGNSLREIVEMADNAVDQVRAIATASEEQSATYEQINRSIAHVNTITQETVRGLQESARAVAELARQSESLAQLIEQMKKS